MIPADPQSRSQTGKGGRTSGKANECKEPEMENRMKKFYKKGIGVALAVTMASSSMVAYAAEATKDGSGAAGLSAEAAPEEKEVDGSQFAGEEWYDQRARPEELTNNLHSYMLPESNRVIWRLNHKQMGLGGDNSWGARPLDNYQIPAGETYEYTYTLKPISTSDVDASMAESKVVMPE